MILSREIKKLLHQKVIQKLDNIINLVKWLMLEKFIAHENS